MDQHRHKKERGAKGRELQPLLERRRCRPSNAGYDDVLCSRTASLCPTRLSALTSRSWHLERLRRRSMDGPSEGSWCPW